MISVVIPTRNSSKDLDECLKSLSKQTYRNFEIIIVFDSKQDVNIDLAKQHKAKALFDKKHTIGGAYFTGSTAAKGDIIAFIDDDCIAPKDWLSKLKKEFEKEIDVVGGEDIIPEQSSSFQKAAYQIDIARVLKSPVFGKSACKRLRTANVAYHKTVFSEDNFNPKLKGLQEPEFHYRLLKKGLRMKFNPSLYVYHKRRSNLKGIFNQIYRNGLAKIELIKMHKEMLSFEDIAPFIAIAYVIIALLTFPVKTALLFATIPFILYFLAKPTVILFRTGNLRYYPKLFAIVLVREIAYGLGILIGIKNIFRR